MREVRAAAPGELYVRVSAQALAVACGQLAARLEARLASVVALEDPQGAGHWLVYTFRPAREPGWVSLVASLPPNDVGRPVTSFPRRATRTRWWSPGR